ncbi:MAG TPA: hypothetical protein VMP01_16775 [Pirellulaceae bacterium]|nr:hypothetical protein [Pirellulaceae bacterium]
MGATSLLGVLSRLRRRAQWIGGAQAASWSAFCAALLVVAAVWIDLAFELPPAYRVGGLLAAVAGGLVSLVLVLVAGYVEIARDQLARQLDRVAGTSGQIRAGMDLAEMQVPASATLDAALSAGLAAMAVERAAVLAAAVPRALVIPLKPLLKAASAVGLVALLLGAAGLLLPDLVRTQWLRFSEPYGDHPPYSSIVFRVEMATTKVRYGDPLDIIVRAEGRSVDSMELVLQPRDTLPHDTSGDVVPMFQEPSGKWRATIANVTQEMNFFARARRARSHKYAVSVITLPQIERVQFKVVPPAYARFPVYDGELPQGGLSGLAGTRVEVQVASNRPLSQAIARYVTSDGDTSLDWPAAASSAKEATGGLTITENGRLEIEVIDVDGQGSKEPFVAPIQLLADERPFVRLIEPKAVSFATPTTRLPVVISAEDDHGVARLELFRSLNDSRYLPMEIPVGQPLPIHAYQVTHLDLESYALEPGDEIKLFARALDNDPAGGKGAESSVVLVRIISQEELAKMLRTRDGLSLLASKYQQVQRRLESLAEEMDQLQKELEQAPADSPLQEELRRRLSELAQRMSEEAEAIDKLGGAPLPYELDKQLSQHLKATSQQLQALAHLARQAADSPASTSGQAALALANLKRRLGLERQAMREQIDPPLDALAKLFPIMEDEARFVALYERQRELAERLATYRDRVRETDSAAKARMRELEEEQRRIRSDLRQLLDDIESHANQLPQEPDYEELRTSALEFAAAVRQSEASEAMKRAEQALVGFVGSRAHREADRARAILESFLGQSEGMGGQAGEAMGRRFQPGLAGSLSQTAAQLLADAGYGMQPGMGSGAGGGYSARRSTLQNVGIYGGLPQVAGASGREGGSSEQSASGGRGDGSGGPRRSGDGGGIDLSDQSAGSGAGEAAVPLQYRRKVGRYFQRLADEIGSQ